MPVSFSSGMVIRDNLDNPLVFISNFTKEKPPGHLIGSRFPVMSSILIDLLQDNGVDNLQIFPAIIWNTDKTTKWDGYFAVNIVGSLTCADLEKSEYGTITPGDGQNIPPLLVMKKLVMKKDFISNDLLFFRLKEDPLWMIAHERVFNLLKENSAPGGWGIDMDELEGS
ncbi:MAG: hypothetical protein HKM94_11050 [Halobacteria archaeon]|nr:hypothetical protein [Halobacteria archaeon]